MSNNFKPLAEQASEKMIAALKAGNSIFHKTMVSNERSQFTLPFNPSTGKNYKGPAALILLMANREDPRWMTLKQASYNKNPVMKGEKGTLINFYKNSEIKPVLDGNGQPELKENGKPKTESVKLEKPVLTDAWLYNAAQLKDMPELAVERPPLSAIEKAQQLMDASKVEFGQEGLYTRYDRSTDMIQVPDLEDYPTVALYYLAAMHELAHASAHESRMNRTVDTLPQGDIGVKEELRANLASVLLSAELDLPYELGYHVSYVDLWAQLMKDEPNELFKAMADAQKIADYVLNFDRQAEKKQDAGLAADQSKLVKGDLIPYNDTQYKVLAELKNKVYQMQDMADGRKFKMSSKDGLFNSLLDAKYNPEMSRAQDFEREEEASLAAEEEQEYQLSR
jgi:antirestriction protein ArdC